MKSSYSHRFFVKVVAAVRTGWACLLVASLFLYVDAMSKVAAVPVLAAVLAILLAGPSLGTVLHNSMGILTVVVPALATTIAVVQILEPPISKVTAVACIAVSSFVISYLSGTHLMGRKVALAQVSVVYIMAHYSQGVNLTVFPLKLIVPDVVGILFAIFATIFPFPRLAVWEVRDSAKCVVWAASELSKTLVRTISVCNIDSFGSLLLHCSVLARAATDMLAEFKSKQVDVSWELGMCGARHASDEFTKRVEYCSLYLKGMGLALERGHVLATPQVLRCTLKSSLLNVVECCRSLLTVSAADLLVLFGPSKENESATHELIEKGKDALGSLDLSYLSARERAYYSPADAGLEIYEDNDVGGDSDREEGTGSAAFRPVSTKQIGLFRGRVSIMFFLFNVRLYCLEAIRLASTGHRCTVPVQHVPRVGKVRPSDRNLEGHAGGEVKETQLSSAVSLEGNAPDFISPVFPGLGESPFVDSGAKKTSSLLGSDRLTHGSCSRRSGPRNAGFDGETQLEADKTHAEHDDRRVEESKPSLNFNSSAEANLDLNPSLSLNSAAQSSSSRLRTSLERCHCSHNTGIAMDKIVNEEGANSAHPHWNRLRKLGIRASWTQTKRSFKTALAMASATVVGVLVLDKPQSFWAPITVGFIIGNYQGGSWRMSYLRLLGTVVGAVFGFLAISASHHHRWAELLFLVPWVSLSSFVRSSPDYDYAGLVSAFTAAILVLGGNDNGAREFAFNRITMTILGILCFVCVETVIFPERAVVLVRQEFVSSLANLRECVRVIVTVYTERGLCLECRNKAVKASKVLEQRLRASFARQSALREEAALEPQLWFEPFPAAVFKKLICIQGRMLDLLFFMACSLHATTEDCLSMTNQMEILLGPLRASLTALQDEVLRTMNVLRETLEMKRISSWECDLLNGLKRLVCRCTTRMKAAVGRGETAAGGGRAGDVEDPQTWQPDTNHPLLKLGHRHRSVDGIPLTVKSVLDAFESSFENVLNDVINATIAQGNKQLISNNVLLSFGSLTFSLHGLLRETVHLEDAVHELLEAENLWNVLDFWESYSDETFHREREIAASRNNSQR